MDIIGYENYLIYNDGRVYNKKYNRFLKQATDHSGYKYVNLSKRLLYWIFIKLKISIDKSN